MIVVASRVPDVPDVSRLFLVAWLLWLISITDVLAGPIDRLNEVPIPPGTHLALVSAESDHNGALVSIATYQSTLSLDDTLAFYHDVWPHEKDSSVPGRLESVVGDWLLISRLRDDVNTVIQLNVTETSRSTGYLSVMAVTSPTVGKSGSHSQGGYREISKTISKDGSMSSIVSVLESNQSVSGFIRTLLRLRKDAGWQVTSQKQHADSQIVLMNRQSQRMEMVLSEGGQGTVIAVVNEVRYEK